MLRKRFFEKKGNNYLLLTRYESSTDLSSIACLISFDPTRKDKLKVSKFESCSFPSLYDIADEISYFLNFLKSLLPYEVQQTPLTQASETLPDQSWRNPVLDRDLPL